MAVNRHSELMEEEKGSKSLLRMLYIISKGISLPPLKHRNLDADELVSCGSIAAGQGSRVTPDCSSLSPWICPNNTITHICACFWTKASPNISGSQMGPRSPKRIFHPSTQRMEQSPEKQVPCTLHLTPVPFKNAKGWVSRTTPNPTAPA